VTCRRCWISATPPNDARRVDDVLGSAADDPAERQTSKQPRQDDPDRALSHGPLPVGHLIRSPTSDSNSLIVSATDSSSCGNLRSGCAILSYSAAMCVKGFAPRSGKSVRVGRCDSYDDPVAGAR
jgi:hypothetical protein